MKPFSIILTIFLILTFNIKSYAEDLVLVSKKPSGDILYFDKDSITFDKNFTRAKAILYTFTPNDKKFSKVAFVTNFALDSRYYMYEYSYVYDKEGNNIKLSATEISQNNTWQIIYDGSPMHKIYEYINFYKNSVFTGNRDKVITPENQSVPFPGNSKENNKPINIMAENNNILNPYDSVSSVKPLSSEELYPSESNSFFIGRYNEEYIQHGKEVEERIKQQEQENIRRSQLTPVERSMEDFNEAYKQGARIETEKLLRANPKYNQQQSFNNSSNFFIAFLIILAGIITAIISYKVDFGNGNATDNVSKIDIDKVPYCGDRQIKEVRRLGETQQKL